MNLLYIDSKIHLPVSSKLDSHSDKPLHLFQMHLALLVPDKSKFSLAWKYSTQKLSNILIFIAYTSAGKLFDSSSWEQVNGLFEQINEIYKNELALLRNSNFNKFSRLD